MAFEGTGIPLVEPLVEPDPHGHGSQVTHPAFAQVMAHRISGRRVLYGSDFLHNGFIRIRLTRSQLNRDLSRDWHHERDMLAEFDMSEAQWATFVSSMNIGGGVPCTLARLPGEIIPEMPLPSRTDTFREDMGEHLRELISGLKEALAEAESKKAPARVKELLRRSIRQAESNLPFVGKSFDKHMETTVEKAKVEIHGYMNQAIRQIGIEHMAATAPLALESDKDDR